jgi:hypothetical protein
MPTIGESRVRDSLARLSRIGGLAVFLPAGLGAAACDHTPSAARADPTSSQANPAIDPGGVFRKPASPPPPLAATPVSPEQIIDIVADRTAYPVPLAGAAKRFAPIATLTRETPAPEVVLMAGSGPGARRVEIGYTEDARGKWVFSQATVLLAPSPPDDVATLHRRLEAALRKKLGKPRFTKKEETSLPQMGWKLGGRVDLWLGEETSTLPGGSAPERHLRLDVAPAGGEGE